MPHPKSQSHDDSHARMAGAPQGEEDARAGASRPAAATDPVTEGGKAESPVRSKGNAMPSASVSGTEDGASHATVGRAEQEEAAAKSGAHDAHGRGRRKHEDRSH